MTVLAWPPASESRLQASKRGSPNRDGCSATVAGGSFSANSRSSRLSRARYTAPMPSAISSGPKRIPGDSGVRNSVPLSAEGA